jgi:hypothetical protein
MNTAFTGFHPYDQDKSILQAACPMGYARTSQETWLPMDAADQKQDPVADLVKGFPGPLALRPSMRKWLWVLAGSIVFVAAGILSIEAPRSAGDARMGWVAVAFFGLGILLSIIVLIPGAAGLTLNADAFVVRNFFHGRAVRWADVGEFAIREVSYPRGSKKFVAYNDHSATGALAAANAWLTGYSRALPDTYGLSVEDLCRLMALWRERALRQPK